MAAVANDIERSYTVRIAALGACGDDQLLTCDRLQDVSWTTARIYQTNRSQDHSEDRDPNQYFFFRKLAHG